MILRCANLTWVYLITALSVWVHIPSSLAGETEQTNVDWSTIDWEVIDIFPEEITEGDLTYAVLNNARQKSSSIMAPEATLSSLGSWEATPSQASTRI